MSTKFIQILVPLLTLISCREYEQISIIENNNETLQTLEKKNLNGDSASGSYSLIVQDSSRINPKPEEDPPVKHGGHWKMK